MSQARLQLAQHDLDGVARVALFGGLSNAENRRHPRSRDRSRAPPNAIVVLLEDVTAFRMTDDDVAVLCDIEKDGSTRPTKREVVESLINRQLIEPAFEGPVERLKVTPHAFQLLTKRGVGLNES